MDQTDRIQAVQILQHLPLHQTETRHDNVGYQLLKSGFCPLDATALPR